MPVAPPATYSLPLRTFMPTELPPAAPAMNGDTVSLPSEPL